MNLVIRRSAAGLALAVLLAMFAAAVWLVTGPPRSAGAGAPSDVEVVDFAFEPVDLTVAAGTTVVWTQTGQAPHTVTSDDGLFDSGIMGAGDSFQFTFTEPGTYPYYCVIHGSPGGGGMAGTITVTGAQAPTTPAPTQEPTMQPEPTTPPPSTPTAEPKPEMPPAPAPGAESVTIPLGPGRDGSQPGTAVLTAIGDSQTQVDVTITPGPKDVPQPGHIHIGSCPVPGAVEYPLTDAINGRSTTVVDVGLSELLAGDYAINFHMSAEQVMLYVACGDIVAAGAPGGGAAGPPATGGPAPSGGATTAVRGLPSTGEGASSASSSNALWWVLGGLGAASVAAGGLLFQVRRAR